MEYPYWLMEPEPVWWRWDSSVLRSAKTTPRRKSHPIYKGTSDSRRLFHDPFISPEKFRPAMALVNVAFEQISGSAV